VPGLPAGSVLVAVRASAAAESRAATIPASFRARNPEEAAFCAGCAARGDLPEEDLVVDATTLGIRNVAVSLKAIAEGILPPLEPLTIDNACCRFVPHVGFAPVGSPLVVSNSDPMSHAILIATLGGTQLYMATIASGDTARTTRVETPGILDVSCPIHPWMRAWIVATRHPYVAVTGASGEARIDRVPAGTHEVVLWHEQLGSAASTVTVAADAVARVLLGAGDFRRR
jgi:hypothetical protein